MNKIKKFKINVRPSYFLRLLKNSVEIEKEEIEKQIQDNHELIDPCTVYESFELEDIKDEDFRRKVEGWAPEVKINSYSVVSLMVVTIGSKLEEEMAGFEDKGSDRDVKILDALGAEALEQSGIFVNKLVLKDAEKEDCTVNAFKKIPEDSLEDTLKLLDANKINVRIDDRNPGLVPGKSIALYGYWTRVKRKRKK